MLNLFLLLINTTNTLLQAEKIDRKSAANDAINDMLDSTRKYAIYKMVNDMKELLDQQEGKCYL